MLRGCAGRTTFNSSHPTENAQGFFALTKVEKNQISISKFGNFYFKLIGNPRFCFRFACLEFWARKGYSAFLSCATNTTPFIRDFEITIRKRSQSRLVKDRLYREENSALRTCLPFIYFFAAPILLIFEGAFFWNLFPPSFFFDLSAVIGFKSEFRVFVLFRKRPLCILIWMVFFRRLCGQPLFISLPAFHITYTD